MTKLFSFMLLTLLSSNMLITNPISKNQIAPIISKNLKAKKFHKTINQDIIDNSCNLNYQYLQQKQTFLGNIGTVLRYDDYATDWEDFADYYQNLTITTNIEIFVNSFKKPATTIKTLNIPLTKITTINDVSNKYQMIVINGIANNKNTNPLFCYLWLENHQLKIQFDCQTKNLKKASYVFLVTVNQVTTKLSNYDDFLNQLAEINNKTVNVESDYSISLQDKRNHESINAAINNLITKTLEGHYQDWQNIINPDNISFSYDDNQNQVRINFHFYNPVQNQIINKELEINVNISLRNTPDDANFQTRLTIIPGKVINQNGKYVDDCPIKYQDYDVYSTATDLNFNCNSTWWSYTMNVNGIDINLQNKNGNKYFYYHMNDNQQNITQGNNQKNINKYDVIITAHNPKTQQTDTHEWTFLIQQNVPQLNLKWQYWKPSDNTIKKTTTTNKYNKINPKTGTTPQIIWIKWKNNTFASDPLDKNGNLINNDNYDNGFMAEAAVTGLGVQTNYEDKWINNVTYSKVNNQNLQDISEPKKSGNDDIEPFAGIFHYKYLYNEKLTADKYIITDTKYNNNSTTKFLDVFQDSKIAVDFWTTIEGTHLKNYLKQQKNIDIKANNPLSFETVLSYWREYVSSVTNHNLFVNCTNIINLNLLSFQKIIIEASDIKGIKNEILSAIQQNLENYKLKAPTDYKVLDLSGENLEKLLNFNTNGTAQTTVRINASIQSLKASGSVQLTVINSKNKLGPIVNFAQNKFNDFTYNFSIMQSDNLKSWIMQAINDQIIIWNYSDKNKNQTILQYEIDFNIKKLTNINFKTFTHSKNQTKLVFKIYALNTTKSINDTTITFIQDQDAPLAPQKPPKPLIQPDWPNPNNSNSLFHGKSLIWIIPFILLTIIITLFSHWWIRNRKSAKIK